MFSANTKNELDHFLNQDAMAKGRQHANEIESVSFGTDSGCGYKNDVFVSFACTEEHRGSCKCQDVLDQQKLINVEIDLELAEKIAHYVSGLLGGKRVYKG